MISSKIKNLKNYLFSGVILAQGGGDFKGIESGTFGEIKKYFDFGSDTLAGSGSAENLLLGIVNILLFFAATVAVIFLVVGGFQYITARGNEDAVETAKKTITGSVIGIIVIVMAFAIIAIVSNLLTKQPAGNDGGGGENPGGGGGGGGQWVDIIKGGDSEMLFIEGVANSINLEEITSGCPPCSWVFTFSPSKPNWINTNTGNGEISGVPPQAEVGKNYTMTVTASNSSSNSSDTETWTIVVGGGSAKPSP